MRKPNQFTKNNRYYNNTILLTTEDTINKRFAFIFRNLCLRKYN